MDRLRIVAILALLVLSTIPSRAAGGATPAGAVKAFFEAVAARQYATAWGYLTQDSKRLICEDLAKAQEVDASDIRALFDRNDPRVQSGFWEPFRQETRSDVMAACTYMARAVNGNRAQVGVLGHDAVFLVFKENGKWKFGLMETFPPGN